MPKTILNETGEDRVCQYFYTVEKELGKKEIIYCDKPADYRVTVYSNIEVLNDDNEYEKTSNLEFYCKDHFDQLYRFPKIEIQFTFRKIKRKPKPSEENP